ncbi:MAG: D-aminoacyl-tRNA deacylase [Candidatus Bathyarchaeia archaeon]
MPQEAGAKPPVLIVASTVDPASKNIADFLIRHHGFWKTGSLEGGTLLRSRDPSSNIRLLITGSELVSFDPSSVLDDVGLFIFVSRHESQSRLSSLTVHAPGNIAEAEHGGVAWKVSVAAPGPMKDALRRLSLDNVRLRLNHLVSYEATHHGPSLDKPALFIEIGSSQAAWSNPKAGEAAANAVMDAAVSQDNYTPALGVGGPHYNPKFTEAGLEGRLALGHIIPKHALLALTPDLLEQCLRRTMGGVHVALVDWKGTPGPARRWIVAELEQRGVEVRRV